MIHLIDKSALVAEIEKRLEKVGHDNPTAYREHRYFLSFIDTLEVKEYCEEYDGFLGKELKMVDDEIERLEKLKVKEVDLEKELESWRHNHFHGRRDKEASGEYLERISQLELAKHFFELGLKAQKGELYDKTRNSR